MTPAPATVLRAHRVRGGVSVRGYRVFDVHVHMQPWDMLRPNVRATMEAGRGDVAEILGYQKDPASFDAFLAKEGVDRAVLINYVAPEVMGFTFGVNEWMSSYVADHKERFVPVGSVHPHHSRDAGGRVQELVKMGIRAIKIHPSHQLVHPHAYHTEGLHALREMYEEAERHGMPIIFHTGTSVFPGARNRFADPLFVDDVAIDFPGLQIVLAHAGRPFWTEKAFFLARRHPNVHLDLSGIPPAKLLDYLPRLESVADKSMFGTDWPSPGVKSIRANVEAFLDLPLSEETKRKVLWDNAARVYGA